MAAIYRTIFRRTGTDKLQNGMIMGILFGAVIIWGGGIYDFLLTIIPLDWQTFAGDLSVPIIILAVGGLLGYFIDRV